LQKYGHGCCYSHGNKIEVTFKINFMKKILSIIAFLALVSCNGGDSASNSTEKTTSENPTAIEDSGTQHATGITNSNVISTDTSKFDVKPVPKESAKK
jgi:hypothetical protein